MAISFDQITQFVKVKKQLQQKAANDIALLDTSLDRERFIENATSVIYAYSVLGAELGAQWYDFCARAYGVNVEKAALSTVAVDVIVSRVIDNLLDIEQNEPTALERLNDQVADEINKSIRYTGNANLRRDSKRGVKGSRWARVPVGETCAFCLMLAGRGAWYLDEETALGTEPDHYHRDCDCTAVYFADAESITGYDGYKEYSGMYGAAETMRINHDYDEELAARIATAKKEHEEKYAAGKTKDKWTSANETLIIMRYMYGLK